ncbi:ABC transporter substrate-binding protein [Paenibacillus physcomitrellae]|uniref:ABC transporter substrate-binding protein n=1 Tax=Paenibacillus physcomitrellae TaxID=1619311 RepID=A0ABQ1GN94_9BACL|nr:ABC transporter substrate-binding protein [Paenibacillus physcomitrellae]GGA47165.1 ABC transporter substrate-binding protein [Paenibacillus physcomitrellae]
MTKKWSLLVGLVLATSMVLSACGGSNNNAAPSNAPASANASNAGESTEASASNDSNDAAGNANGIIKASDMSLLPANAAARKDTLVVGMVAPQGIFNPLFSSTVYDNYVNDVIFDTFITVKADGSYENSLADSVEITNDNKTYTYHLKQGVKYTDGTPVTVKDYYFALKVMLDPTYDGESDLTLANIVGTKEYKEGSATEISGVKIIDDNTIQIDVTDYDALTQVYLGTIPFVSEAYYGKGFKKGSLDSIKSLNSKPLGSGPYVLSSYKAGQEVDFTANADYFKGAPKIPNLIYRVTTEGTNLALIQSGETDMDNITVSPDNIEELEAMGFVDVNILPNNGYGYIGMNLKEDKFADQKVRQALTYGLNRKDIVESVYGDYANVIDIPESKVSWAYTDENITHYDFDPEKAKQLLDEAGWKVGSDGIREKDGKKFEINFSATADNPVVDALLPIMTQNYKDLGINLKAETLDFNAIMDKADKGDFDMYFAAWGLTPDPDNTVYITNGAQNRFGYSNATVDELMAKGRKELDLEKRKEIYKQMYQELNKDVPAILMYQRTNMYGISGRVSGFDLSPYKDFDLSLYQAELQQ